MSSQGFVGDLLIGAGVVDAAGLALGLERQSRQSTTLGRALSDLGLADEGAVAAAMASAMQLEYLDAVPPDVSQAVGALFPVAFFQKRGAALLGVDGDAFRVAVTDPLDYSVLQDVEFRTGKKAVTVVITQTWLERHCHPLLGDADQAAHYDMLTEVEPSGEIEATSDAEYDLVDPAALAKDIQQTPVIKLVNLILSDAAKAAASDVHIEPHETRLHVRQRVDGLLHDLRSSLTICRTRRSPVSSSCPG
jgi:type IV pilus assembly protein PilB